MFIYNYRTFGTFVVFLMSTLILTNCDSNVTSDSFSSSQSQSKQKAKATPLESEGYLNHDEQVAKLAQKIEGLGGLYINKSGQLSIYLTNPSEQRTTAQRVLSNTTFITSSLSGLKTASIQTMNVEKGNYAFSELMSWHKTATKQILGMDGLVATDIVESENILRIDIKSEEVKEKVIQRLESLNIPRKAVTVVITPPVERYDLRNRFQNYVGGGAQIFPEGLSECTMGPTARGGLNQYFLANSHCTATMGNVDGTEFYQPVTTIGSPIGEEIVDPPFTASANCPAGRVCRHSDAALIENFAFTTMEAYEGLIIKTENRVRNNGTTDAAENITDGDIAGNIFVTHEANFTFEGAEYDKIGRTTGWSYGPLTRACVNVNDTQNNQTLLCQNEVQAGSDGGDSGSPVFRPDLVTGPDSVSLAGMLWGGYKTFDGTPYYYFSHIGNIKNEIEAASTVSLDFKYYCFQCIPPSLQEETTVEADM